MWRRYVAIGDSTSEGLDDPDGRGGFRGWADRFAEHVAAAHPGLEYANLAIRGRETAEIEQEQLPLALALRPDLCTVVSGVNDMLRRRFDVDDVVGRIGRMQSALVGAGATVLTFTMPDPVRVMPLARPLRGRFEAYNAALREVSAASGAVLLDLGAYEVAGDPRLWSPDRLHANSAGHERIGRGLAWALGLPGFDGSWGAPLPDQPRRTVWQRAAADGAWLRGYLLPWLVRHARGQSSGDGITAKRPHPLPVHQPH
ncbi:SGNH/GDSL hydrolase family protein [Catellatospora sp. TT07R-123]|uniref:SGNH/GDSL hydrolase family protein n=1 Tax=Catellatospora sp. TT07R-123 TaxID=2733863 RepID=UPI001FCFA80B|nr:SGNH/GDSL hydrolase family protein [Catellatospora sp. TT07R-123]